MHRTAIVVLMLLAAAPAFGDQSTPNPAANARLGALRQAGDPYGRLFQAQQLLKKAIDEKAAAKQPTIVCGMLVIPADPAIDPKMLITPPQDPKVEYRIRTVEPPICNPSK